MSAETLNVKERPVWQGGRVHDFRRIGRVPRGKHRWQVKGSHTEVRQTMMLDKVKLKSKGVGRGVERGAGWASCLGSGGVGCCGRRFCGCF